MHINTNRYENLFGDLYNLKAIQSNHLFYYNFFLVYELQYYHTSYYIEPKINNQIMFTNLVYTTMKLKKKVTSVFFFFFILIPSFFILLKKQQQIFNEIKFDILFNI